MVESLTKQEYTTSKDITVIIDNNMDSVGGETHSV